MQHVAREGGGAPRTALLACRLTFALVCLVAVAFGVLVEVRSAFLKRRMTDLGVYLRTAWAVRAGTDIYDAEDDNGWHYQYPPLFAILMTPLADPPAGVERTGALPYKLSVGLWYLFNLGCLAFGVHTLAGALQERRARGASSPLVGEGWGGGDQYPPPGANAARVEASCRWWSLRLLPLLACLPPVGHTLMRGQVNLLLLALLCGLAAAALRGRRFRAGLWLAGAICLKLIPAFLLLYPLWRRDGRCLAGCGLGLLLGLAVVPAAVFGPARARDCYGKYYQVLLSPALGVGADRSRARELIEVPASASQSFLAAIHNTRHLDRATRPRQPAAAVRLAHWTAAGLMTLITLLAAGWRRPGPGTAPALFLGTLTLAMLLTSPVCQLHYFCLSLPLLMSLLAGGLDPAGRPGRGWTALAVAHLIATTLPLVPGLEVLRDLGLAMYGALVLWAVGCVRLWRQARVGRGVGQLAARIHFWGRRERPGGKLPFATPSYPVSLEGPPAETEPVPEECDCEEAPPDRVPGRQAEPAGPPRGRGAAPRPG